MKYVVPKELLPLLRSKVTRKEVEEMIGSGRYLPIASASTLGAIRVGDSLTIDSDGVLNVVGSGVSVEWGNISDKPTTIAGYGITDAGISGNTITLGNTSITPLTSFTETDPTVPSWAKQANKPSYAYSEISGTPTNVSTFTNDAGYLTEHQSLDGLTPKVQAIPYIVGPDTDTTAGTWTGTYTGITELTEGLTIVYVSHVAGASTTTLNINGLGAKTCYWTGTSKLTTHYPAGTPIIFTYNNNGWRRADSNTTYSAGTKALFDAGANTSNRVWSASVLAASVAPIEHEHDWSDINNTPAFITADALNGYATEQYVDTEISDLNLGTASQKDYTTSVTQGGADLPTSDAVYSAISLAVTSALHYRGMSSTAITDGGTETATIGGQPLTAQSGDIVIYNGLEFLWEEGYWNKLGDDSSYALKTVTVTGTDGITGGGDLTANRTLGLSSTTQTNINKGVTAYGWGDHSQAGYLTSFTETDPTVPSWAKAVSKPTYTAAEVGALPDTTNIPSKTSDLTNDSGFITSSAIPTNVSAFTNDAGYLTQHQSLAGYLPLTAGSTKALTGELYLDATSDKNYIYGQHASDEAYVVIGMSAAGNLVIGSSDFQSAQYKSYIYAYEHNLYWGAGTNKRLYFTSAGVIRPTTTNIISLGTSSYKYKELYATTLYGNLDWSYIDDTPTTLAGYGITDAQKAITVSSSEPTSSQGSDGDIWLVI